MNQDIWNTLLLADTVPELAEAVNPTALSRALERLGNWMIGMGGRLLLALVLFLVGRKIIGIVKRMLNRSLERAGVELGVARFLKSLVEFGLYAVLLFMIAGQLGINTASIIALMGTASLALGLSLQESLGNFAGGVLILVMKPYRVGDYIVSSEGEGTVSMIGLVYTSLLTVDNKKITIPNGKLAGSTVTNVTAMDERRLDLTVGIGYKSDLKKAKEILERLYREHPAILKDKDITVFVDSLGDSAVMLGVRGWVAVGDYWQARWDLTEQMKLAFDEAGIEIPFQQMDVHIVQS